MKLLWSSDKNPQFTMEIAYIHHYSIINGVRYACVISNSQAFYTKLTNLYMTNLFLQRVDA